MAEGFLSRWSRRKQESRDEGAPRAGDEPAAKAGSPQADARASAATAGIGAGPPVDAQAAAAAQGPGEEARAQSAGAAAASPAAAREQAGQPAELPSIDSLTPQSDFRPFMRAEVAPETRNAALKKLFADPHFNEMDGLDIYIDDYGKPDPIPLAMLRKMNQARMLGLFSDDEEEGEGARPPANEARSGADAPEAAEPGPAATEAQAQRDESIAPAGDASSDAPTAGAGPRPGDAHPRPADASPSSGDADPALRSGNSGPALSPAGDVAASVCGAAKPQNSTGIGDVG